MSEIVHCASSLQVTLSGFSLLQSCWNSTPRHLENYSKMAAYCLHRLLTMLSYVDLGRKQRSFLHSLKFLNTHEKCLDSNLKTNLHLCKVQHAFFIVYAYPSLSRSSDVLRYRSSSPRQLQGPANEPCSGFCSALSPF